MKKARRALPPDRISTYFLDQRGPLIAITVSGLIYNIGLTAGPYFEGKLAQCLVPPLSTWGASPLPMWRPYC